MKRWKKYVFCVICACCVGLLAGCGNKNDGVTQNGKATEAMPETKENRKETPNAEINDKRATMMPQTEAIRIPVLAALQRTSWTVSGMQERILLTV